MQVVSSGCGWRDYGMRVARCGMRSGVRDAGGELQDQWGMRDAGGELRMWDPGCGMGSEMRDAGSGWDTGERGALKSALAAPVDLWAGFPGIVGEADRPGNGGAGFE